MFFFNNIFGYVFQDWSANPDSLKSRLVLLLFRYVKYLKIHPGVICKIISVPFSVLYTIIVHWIMGIEIPIEVIIGKNLQLFHGVGLVLHPAVVIGEGCVLRHCTTLGSKVTAGSGPQTAPVLGNYVDVGCNAVILGHISVGNNSIIGAGSVVVRDVPENAVVCGNPAKVIDIREPKK
jgi:putative colanic acid biosynthesis acetyltransferase WcaB